MTAVSFGSFFRAQAIRADQSARPAAALRRSSYPDEAAFRASASLGNQVVVPQALAVKPLAVDLCCGLGGWSEGLLAEGWDVVGFDVKRHKYGSYQYPAQLVLQDILMLSGEQFRGKVKLIVASPPCQFFSYCAMPWTLAKQLAVEVRADPVRLEKELQLFKACERIGREAGCPIVIENVRGAQPWIGRSKYSYGSFYLWGDVPALMPSTAFAQKFNPDGTSGKGKNPDGRKHHGSGAIWFDTGPAALPSSSLRRKAASAMIAKIPAPLSRHIARWYFGDNYVESLTLEEKSRLRVAAPLLF